MFLKSLRASASASLLTVIAACGTTASEGDVEVLESQQATCTSGLHECPAWGATCNGSTLTTCVVGVDGCRKLLEQTCALGCDGATNACKTCDALTSPVRSSSLASPTAFYQSLVKKGDIAIASWRKRNAQYTERGRGITAVDLTNASALAELGTSAQPDNEDALQLALDGDRLFGIVTGSRIQIWDASNPSSLVRLGSYTPAEAPRALAVAGGIAYVGTPSGIEIVDVSNPNAPAMKSVLATTVSASAIAVSGKYLAIAGGSAVEIADVSDPSQPALLPGAKQTFAGEIYSYWARPLAFDGTRLAIASGTLTTFELTAAGAFEPRGTLADVGAEKLLFDGDELVIDTQSAVGTIDVADLKTPRWKKHAFVGQEFQRITDVVRDGSILYTSGTEGVSAVDLTKTGDVTLLPTSGRDWLGGAVTKGGIAYLARTKSGLVIEDIRDPKNPVVLSKTAMTATSIALDGHYAYVGVRDEGLRIYDVRSPWAPALVGQAAAPMVGNVSVSGNRAYAMCGIGYTCVFDVSVPSAPALLVQSDAILRAATFSSAWIPTAMQGSQLFVIHEDKLSILDLANHAAPVTKSQFALGGMHANAKVAVSGSHAYVAYDCHYVYGDTCVDVIDVSDPSAPQKVGTLADFHRINAGTYQTLNASPTRASLHVVGNHLYLTNQWGGVLVVDVSTPTAPKALGELYTFLAGREHFVVGNTLTVYTERSFPQTGPEKSQDQVIEVCR